MIGRPIQNPTGGLCTVLGFHGDDVLVRTDSSPEAQPVSIREFQKGLDLLAEHGTIQVNVDEPGHGSPFVGAVLAKFPNAYFSKDRTAVSFEPPSDAETAEDIHYGTLETIAKVKVRQEQARLRKLLAGDKSVAACVLCGDDYPIAFLVAAHIKKRAICADDERRNLSHIAMLVCGFGCDAVHELGWITVDIHGHIQTTPPDHAAGWRAP